MNAGGVRDPDIGNTGVGIGKAGGLHQQLPPNVYRVDPSGPRRPGGAVRDRARRPTASASRPITRKVYVIRGGGISVGDVQGTKVANLRAFTDCMVDGVRCGPDGMRADRAGNIWCSSRRAAGLCRRHGVESGRQADRPHPPARALRQSLLRRPQARPSVHVRHPVDLHAAGEYPGRKSPDDIAHPLGTAGADGTVRLAIGKGSRTGAIRNRWMILRREDDPFSYWMTVASCAVFILACAVATANHLGEFAAST